MKILALDPSGTVGWAVTWERRAAVLDTYKLQGTHRAERLNDYRRWLTDKVDARHASPDLVAFEEPIAFRGAGTVFLAGLCAVTEMVCEEARVPFASVHVSTLKKFATGKGNAKKPDMIRAATELLGHAVNEHEADAYFVARWARENVTLGVEG
jgi:crossover junction endodeoxyribonuclease RuvC